MKKFMNTLALGASLAFIAAGSAQADNKTKTETKLIGYDVTTTTYVSNFFEKADANNDQYLSYEEYADISLKDNEYATFLLIDSDNNKLLDMNEYDSYAPGKGFTKLKEGRTRNWNTNRKALIEKHYFVPVSQEEYR